MSPPPLPRALQARLLAGALAAMERWLSDHAPRLIQDLPARHRLAALDHVMTVHGMPTRLTEISVRNVGGSVEDELFSSTATWTIGLGRRLSWDISGNTTQERILSAAAQEAGWKSSELAWFQMGVDRAYLWHGATAIQRAATAELLDFLLAWVQGEMLEYRTPISPSSRPAARL